MMLNYAVNKRRLIQPVADVRASTSVSEADDSGVSRYMGHRDMCVPPRSLDCLQRYS